MVVMFKKTTSCSLQELYGFLYLVSSIEPVHLAYSSALQYFLLAAFLDCVDVLILDNRVSGNRKFMMLLTRAVMCFGLTEI